MKKICACTAMAVLALGLAACGSSGGGTTPSGGSTFADCTTLSVTGVNTDANFATNGRFTVGFVAQDANGDSILASQSAPALVIKTMEKGLWLKSFLKDTAGISCAISTPASTACTEQLISSTQPSTGKVVGAVDIDDSGSMAGSDPSTARAPAAKAFLDSICSCTSGASCTNTTNKFGVFDFSPGGNLGNNELRDLLTVEGLSLADGPFPSCNDANVTAARTAIDHQVGDVSSTPLYTALNELCEDMVAASSSSILAGFSPAILLLSDGYPNTETPDLATAKTAAESCITTNNITVCTVGLGDASTLQNTTCTCTTDANCTSNGSGADVCESGKCAYSSLACTAATEITDCGYPLSCSSDNHCEVATCSAIDVLQDLATKGDCVYAAATDATALQPIFNAIGTAISQGQNFAQYAVTPIPTTPGTTVTGTLTVGSATATFTFIVP